jgi:hypothetical protein
MKRRRFLLPTGRSVPLMGITLGLALSLGNVWVIAAPGQVPGDRPEAEPNAEPAKRASLAVHGLVIDATTKRAIARFRVIPGALTSPGVTWQPHLITTHRGGRFDFPPTERVWDPAQWE